jgi:cell division protein FtsB
MSRKVRFGRNFARFHGLPAFRSGQVTQELILCASLHLAGVFAPMALLSTSKRLLKGVLVPALFLAVSGYFVWHAVHGERGLMARDKRQADIVSARAELTRAETERDAMERRVTGLRGDRLDRDQLEERARSLLNMVGRDEVIVPYGPERRLY